ncbi:hypothetical protein ACFU7T_39610 [Streptomyces sp. NPDC057555]
MIGLERTGTDWKSIAARRPPEMAADLRKPRYGRFLAMTMRWT